jgi:cardiolipin synthase
LTGLELLVGSAAFWARARADFAAAKRRLLVQAMTFEGDAAGRAVAEAIAASAAADRRVLVDAYSRVVLSDKWVGPPRFLLPRERRAEAAATDAMFRALKDGGVGVKLTNPLSRLMTSYPARNHKKLIVADDVAYIGGINFSDHNFAWADSMIRLEGEAAAEFLAADFAATYAGAPRGSGAVFDGFSLACLDGRGNGADAEAVRSLIASARREIVAVSAYLTFPFTTWLAAAARRGVRVRLITPWDSNKPAVKRYLLAFAARHGFEVTLTASMSHLKGLLIDDRALVAGSCNFDFVGLEAEEEIIAVIERPALIAAFNDEVVAPAVAGAIAPRTISPVAAASAHALLAVGRLAARAARGARRTAVEWR